MAKHLVTYLAVAEPIGSVDQRWLEDLKNSPNKQVEVVKTKLQDIETREERMLRQDLEEED